MSKTLYLIRGLSDSGKTTLAKNLVRCLGAKHIEADMYPNRYLRDGTLNPNVSHSEAHTWVYNNVYSWMCRSVQNIIVSNVFHKLEQLEPYLYLAAYFGYNVDIIHKEGLIWNTERDSVPRGVPDEVKRRWFETWERWNSLGE